MTARPPPSVLVLPFVVAVDTREQAPYTFTGLRSDARLGRTPLVVRCERQTLPTGDYSIVGHESGVVVERKSLADLYGTLGQGRARFTRELERLQEHAEHGHAAVVMEAEWSDILERPPARSRLRPKTVFRSVLAWQMAFPGVHWWSVAGRRMGEVVTFRLLERWWRIHETP